MSNFNDFLQKHKFQPMADSFIPTADDIELRVSKLERELDIPEEEIINDELPEDIHG